MTVSYGPASGTGLVSVEYSFEGVAAHAANVPWRGRSALDAVELMNVGWNYRREHLNPLQRSHYVITNGGDQPNVVPPTAAVWYFLREIDARGIRENAEILDRIAQGAALMTDTTMKRRVVGAAYPRHFNKPIALAMQANIDAVGLPQWSNDDQRFARAVQKFMGADEAGLVTELSGIEEPSPQPVSGGSDDIGDVSWVVPTVTLRYPANIGGIIGHHWSSAMAMATPIAHKGATAGAKVQALTTLDLMTKPTLITQAWDYFRNVQTKDIKYFPLMRPEDKPPIWMNKVLMDRVRPEMKKFYYDPTKYKTYLDQLGIKYPMVRDSTKIVP
jgi:aminobenzoyl-glutamate utilization protein B